MEKVALNRAYSCLPSATFDRDQMNQCTQDFLLQYVGLHKLFQNKFGLKPKSHLMAELAFTSYTSPTAFWTYRDEDFGGFVAQMASRRGGANNPFSVGTSFFDRFAALHHVPSDLS